MAFDEVPHLKVPFRLVEGRAETVDQDTEEEILQCVEVIARTPLGFREDSPDFGIDDPTFRRSDANMDDLQAAISQWEPRADSLIEERPSLLDVMIQNFRVRVRGEPDG